MGLHQNIQAKHGLEQFRAQYLRRRTQGMGAAVFQQQNAVSVARRQVQVVEDHQHSRATISKAADRL